MNYYGYMPITTDPVVLHLDGCKDWGALHRRIRKTFGFPDYYGENWDAMWDCLTDVFLQPVQRHIVWKDLTPCPGSCGSMPLRCGKSSVTFRKNIRGSQ